MIFIFACIGSFGCASGDMHWKPVAGWENLDTRHRAQTIEHCKRDAEFDRCMYANSYVYSRHGAVMPLKSTEPGQREIAVTELKP